MIEKENIELFEGYLQGVLSESEKNQFEARLIYDQDFANSFEEFKELETGIKSHFRAEMKTKLSEIDSQLDQKPSKGKVIKLVTWTSSVAAAILIGLFIIQHFGNFNKIELEKEYWPIEPGLPVKMSTKGKYDDAMNAYKMKDFDLAAKLFGQIDSDTADYFLGLSFYELNELEKAIISFERIEMGSNYFETSQLCLAIILLTDNNEEDALKILENSKWTRSNQEKVSQILKRLNN